MRSNCPKKYCVEHAKHASKVYLDTDECNHRIIKLKNNSLLKRDQSHFDGKGSEGQKLTIVSPYAARSTRVYLEIGEAPRCTSIHNIRQRAIPTHYRRSRSMLNPLRHTDPWFRIIFWSNYVLFREASQHRRLVWTAENGKLNEAGDTENELQVSTLPKLHRFYVSSEWMS